MSRLVPFAAGLALIAVMTLPTASRADNQDTIDYRQHIMKSLGETSGAIAQIMQGKAPADNLAVHIQVLAVIASTAEKAFEPKVAGGQAKPDVWANWADFDKKMKEFVANTADLAKTAQSGGMAAVQPKLATALTCKGCHDTYRDTTKK